MPILNIPEHIDIDFTALTNEQRQTIKLIMEGDGLQNPLAIKIQECIDACNIEITAIENFNVNEVGITEQQKTDLLFLLGALIIAFEQLSIFTDRISGSSRETLTEFVERLQTAHTYTKIMNSITGKHEEKYTFLFDSIMNAGELCLDRTLKQLSCDETVGVKICGNLDDGSGIVGLAQHIINTPSDILSILNCLLPALIECTEALIEDDNYCQARKTIETYSFGGALSSSILDEPIQYEVIKQVVGSHQLKQSLLKLQEELVASDEATRVTSIFFKDFPYMPSVPEPEAVVNECDGECCEDEYIWTPVVYNCEKDIIFGPTGPPGPTPPQPPPGGPGPPGPSGGCECEPCPVQPCCIGHLGMFLGYMCYDQCLWYGGAWGVDAGDCSSTVCPDGSPPPCPPDACPPGKYPCACTQEEQDNAGPGECLYTVCCGHDECCVNGNCEISGCVDGHCTSESECCNEGCGCPPDTQCCLIGAGMDPGAIPLGVSGEPLFPCDNLADAAGIDRVNGNWQCCESCCIGPPAWHDDPDGGTNPVLRVTMSCCEDGICCPTPQCDGPDDPNQHCIETGAGGVCCPYGQQCCGGVGCCSEEELCCHDVLDDLCTHCIMLDGSGDEFGRVCPNCRDCCPEYTCDWTPESGCCPWSGACCSTGVCEDGMDVNVCCTCINPDTGEEEGGCCNPCAGLLGQPTCICRCPDGTCPEAPCGVCCGSDGFDEDGEPCEACVTSCDGYCCGPKDGCCGRDHSKPNEKCATGCPTDQYPDGVPTCCDGEPCLDWHCLDCSYDCCSLDPKAEEGLEMCCGGQCQSVDECGDGGCKCPCDSTNPNNPECCDADEIACCCSVCCDETNPLCGGGFWGSGCCDGECFDRTGIGYQQCCSDGSSVYDYECNGDLTCLPDCEDDTDRTCEGCVPYGPGGKLQYECKPWCGCQECCGGPVSGGSNNQCCCTEDSCDYPPCHCESMPIDFGDGEEMLYWCCSDGWSPPSCKNGFNFGCCHTDNACCLNCGEGHQGCDDCQICCPDGGGYYCKDVSCVDGYYEGCNGEDVPCGLIIHPDECTGPIILPLTAPQGQPRWRVNQDGSVSDMLGNPIYTKEEKDRVLQEYYKVFPRDEDKPYSGSVTPNLNSIYGHNEWIRNLNKFPNTPRWEVSHSWLEQWEKYIDAGGNSQKNVEMPSWPPPMNDTENKKTIKVDDLEKYWKNAGPTDQAFWYWVSVMNWFVGDIIEFKQSIFRLNPKEDGESPLYQLWNSAKQPDISQYLLSNFWLASNADINGVEFFAYGTKGLGIIRNPLKDIRSFSQEDKECDDCALGACCFGLNCVEGFTESQCQYVAGNFLGEFTKCEGENPCDAPSACCHTIHTGTDDEMITCTNTTTEGCESKNGIYYNGVACSELPYGGDGGCPIEYNNTLEKGTNIPDKYLWDLVVSGEKWPVIGIDGEVAQYVPLAKPMLIEPVTTKTNFRIINFIADEKIKTEERPPKAGGGWTPLSNNSKSKISITELITSDNIERAKNTKTEMIEGSVTTSVDINSLSKEKQVITFVSGSNIRLDTNRDSSIIRISVDDIKVQELLGVFSVTDSITNSPAHLKYDSSSSKWVTSMTEPDLGPTGPNPTYDYDPGCTSTHQIHGAVFSEGCLLYHYDPEGGTKDIKSTNNIMFDRFGGLLGYDMVLGFTADVELYSGFTSYNTSVSDNRIPAVYINDNIFEKPKFKNTSELASESYRDVDTPAGEPISSGGFSFGPYFGTTGGNIQYIEATGGGAGTVAIIFLNPPPSGVVGTMTLFITNGGLFDYSSDDLILNGLWPGGTSPTLQNDGIDIISVTTIDGGSNYYCFLNGENMS